MEVQFNEGPESLSIPLLGVIAKRGEPINVPDSVGTNLLDQGWVKAGGTPSPEPSPAAIKKAEELGIPIASVEGTGANGNVTVKDVKAAANVAEADDGEKPEASNADDGEDPTDPEADAAGADNQVDETANEETN
ncbi:MAG TPA: E3 binding domain-containing protein [Solirubrobacterales bacterium]|nr:E3 binding domain-containing protein [Solirubrobacterales bacterium]